MSASLSRRRFIALAGGSVAAGSLLAACGSDSNGNPVDTSHFGKGDVGILNFMLTLEYIEVAFYSALAEGKLLSPDSQKVLGRFGEEEEKHVEALTKAIEKLGGKPAPKPRTEFSMDDESSALEQASELENAGAAAYLGQVLEIKSGPALATVLSIHSVEGRHASAVDTLLDGPVTPDGAFAKPMTRDEALEAMEPFIAG